MLKAVKQFFAPERKQSAVGALIALQRAGRAQWTARNDAAMTEAGFICNAVGYRCVRMIAEAAASLPWLAYEGGRELDRHPLLEVLRHPQPMLSGRALMEQLYGHLQTAGNAYLEAVRVDGSLNELHALRPDRMRVVPGGTGWPEAYEYSVNGRSLRLAPESVLHLKLFHPLDDYYGLSPLVAAGRAVDIHNASAAWNKAMLDNAARPSGALIFKGEGALSESQFERLKQELESAYQGADNAGRPMVLEGGLDWKQMSHSPKEMDFIEARNGAARDIALAFGVPPMLLGIPGDNTFANYAEANRTFWRQTVLPLAARTAEAISNWAGDGAALGFDLDQVEALSAERESLWARVTAADFLTAEEKRAAVGY